MRWKFSLNHCHHYTLYNTSTIFRCIIISSLMTRYYNYYCVTNILPPLRRREYIILSLASVYPASAITSSLLPDPRSTVSIRRDVSRTAVVKFCPRTNSLSPEKTSVSAFRILRRKLQTHFIARLLVRDH